MYSLPGYIEKKRSELKIVIKVKNYPIMIRAVLQKKSTYFEFEVNCKIKRSGIKAQETIEILPINIVIQT